MTTWDEFTELVAEMERLWPNSTPWPAGTIQTLYEILKHHDPVDLFAANNHWFMAGNSFPPNPSQLAAAVADVAREQRPLRQERLALPLETGSITLSQYLEQRGFRSLEEAIEASTVT